jgi:hypothetical protein
MIAEKKTLYNYQYCLLPVQFYIMTPYRFITRTKRTNLLS